MHGSTRDRLEALLGEGKAQSGLDAVTDHLTGCAECSAEVAAMKAQSQLIRMLRAPEVVEPAGGFYARVMQRIEERAKESMWASLIYSPVSSRIAYASLNMALLLGSYVIAAERRDGHLAGGTEIAQSSQYDQPVVGDASQQRDAVLANFASH